MRSTTMQSTTTTRHTVFAGLIGAAYAVATLALAPVSFGPIQFRIAGLLVPLALMHPAYALGLAVGLALANLMSPFGAWDYFAMPVALYLACRLGYRMRRAPWLALPVMAAWSAAAIAYFPLHLGGGIPFWPTAGLIFVSLLVLYLVGWYGIWRNSPLYRPASGEE